jgi:hypothetical protein
MLEVTFYCQTYAYFKFYALSPIGLHLHAEVHRHGQYQRDGKSFFCEIFVTNFLIIQTFLTSCSRRLHAVLYVSLYIHKGRSR